MSSVVNLRILVDFMVNKRNKRNVFLFVSLNNNNEMLRQYTSKNNFKDSHKNFCANEWQKTPWHTESVSPFLLSNDLFSIFTVFSFFHTFLSLLSFVFIHIQTYMGSCFDKILYYISARQLFYFK